MRAWNVPDAGAQPTLSELPVPEPGPGSVLVRVKAAGLNAIDAALAAGYMAQMMPHEYPVVLGRDAAGVVEAVGAGVDHVRPGDEVIGHVLLAPPIRQGTLAEYALLPAEAVTPKPSGLDFESAAALPLAGTAALAAVDAVDPQPGQAVLVVGAGGGVGSYAVQLAAARGATVVATGTPDDVDRLIKLGATTVVDHTAGSVAEQVRVAYPAGVDALIDLVARTPDELPLSAVRAGGVVASTNGAADEPALAARGLRASNLLARASREVVGPLAEQAAAGALIIDIGQTLPFERAGEGLAAFFDGHVRGKTVVRI